MTPTDQAAELLRLRERATAGNWWHDKGQVRTDIGGSPVGRVGLVIWQGVRGYQPEERIANGEFVAYAANHAAAIVAEMQGEIERLRMELELHKAGTELAFLQALSRQGTRVEPQSMRDAQSRYDAALLARGKEAEVPYGK